MISAHIAAARQAQEAQPSDGSDGSAKKPAAAAALEVDARAVVVLMPDEQVLCGLPVEELNRPTATSDGDISQRSDAGSEATAGAVAAAAAAATGAERNGSFAGSPP